MKNRLFLARLVPLVFAALLLIAPGIASLETPTKGTRWRLLSVLLPAIWLALVGPDRLVRRGGFLMPKFGAIPSRRTVEFTALVGLLGFCGAVFLQNWLSGLGRFFELMIFVCGTVGLVTGVGVLTFLIAIPGQTLPRVNDEATALGLPPPGRNFQLDWQFAVDVSKFPMARPASMVISLTPLFLNANDRFGFTEDSVLLLWTAAVIFLVAWVLLYLRCPKFIREYRDYGAFQARAHSHRWIVWEFYWSLETLEGWRKIVSETLDKRLSRSATSVDEDIIVRKHPSFKRVSNGIQIFEPVNHDRDIFLPFHFQGQKLVLPIQEKDGELAQKEQELFWILYSQATKERAASRAAYWVLLVFSLLFLAANVVKNIYIGWDQLLN